MIPVLIFLVNIFLTFSGAAADEKSDKSNKLEAEISYFDPALPKLKWPIEEAIAHRKRSPKTPYVLKKVPIVDLEKETKPLREFFFEGKSLDEILQQETVLTGGIKAFVPVGSRIQPLDNCLEYPLSECHEFVVNPKNSDPQRVFGCTVKTTKSGLMSIFLDSKRGDFIRLDFAWWEESKSLDFSILLVAGKRLFVSSMATGSPRDLGVDCTFPNPSGVMNGPEVDPAIAFTKAVLEKMVKSNPRSFRSKEKK